MSATDYLDMIITKAHLDGDDRIASALRTAKDMLAIDEARHSKEIAKLSAELAALTSPSQPTTTTSAISPT